MTRQRTLLLTVAVIVLAGVAFYTYALRPQLDRKAAADTALSTALPTLTQAQADLAAGREAQEAQGRNEAQVLENGTAVPKDLDQPSLVYQLNAAAKASGLDFVSVSLAGADGATPADGTASTVPPGAVAGTDGVALQPLDLEFEGTYFELARFLERVRGFVRPTPEGVRSRGRLISAEAVSIKTAGSGFPTLRATVNATTYLESDDAAASTSPATGATAPGTAATPTPTPATADSTAGGVSDR